MSVRTTHAAQRLDMMLTQAERFLALGLRGEALARARQLVVHAARELETQGPEAHPAIEARRSAALHFLEQHRAFLEEHRGAGSGQGARVTDG